MDIQAKRVAVINMFGGSIRWQARVQSMSDAQITAIYLRKLNEPPADPPNWSPTPEPEPSEEQLALDLGE